MKPIFLTLLFLPLAIAAVAEESGTPMTPVKSPVNSMTEEVQTAKPTVAEAQAWMDSAEAELLDMSNLAARAAWVQATFITDDTEIVAAKEGERVIARTTELLTEAKRYESLDLPPDLRRKILILKTGLTLPAPSDPKLRTELTQLAASLDGSYGRGKYCPDSQGGNAGAAQGGNAGAAQGGNAGAAQGGNAGAAQGGNAGAAQGGNAGPTQGGDAGAANDESKCLGIEELDQQMAASRDPEELLRLWQGWHKVGVPMRDHYARFVDLSNQGARELGFADTGALWRSGYDMPPEAFSADIERLWSQLQPLYLELHAYVRTRLIQKYGAAATRPDGMIPAHLTGNMWAQEWGNIYDIVAPASAPETYNIGKILAARATTPKQLVQFGENFFESLGFQPLPDTFWKRSQLTRPRDRDVVCHVSAWDVDNDMDVRLKMCIHVSSDDFITVHHELGHNYYQMAYRKQPFLFRNGANDGFHEAIGDSIALSITPEYLKQIGLINTIPPAEADIPLQLRTALDKIAFLPFGLLIDKWRWQVFSGQTKPADYNKAWWALREQYQGVAPPIDRTEADFDPGAKYHIPGNTPYIRYFLARVYQFQFYRAMCRASGYKGPLNRCSFYGSKEAGAKLNAMLESGQSKPWPEALKAMTGEDKADASAMVEYFQPLLVWLREQNKGQKSGWTVSGDPLKAAFGRPLP